MMKDAFNCTVSQDVPRVEARLVRLDQTGFHRVPAVKANNPEFVIRRGIPVGEEGVARS